MSDSAYIFMQGEIKRLEAEAAKIKQRLTAARAFVASYENGEEPVIENQYTGAEPTAVLPNGADAEMVAAPKPNPIIRFPQVANGHRLRPGTFKYDVIRGAFDLLVSQTPLLKLDQSGYVLPKLHKREIVRHLTQNGVLAGLSNPMDRASVILSQAKGILASDGGGNWFIDPDLVAESKENHSE